MKISTFIEAMVVATALISCEHQQELCLDHSDNERRPVEVIFDWSQCPDADPQSMSLYLFPEGCYQPIHYYLHGSTGGIINVLPGRYSVVAINADTENTAIHYGKGMETFEISLRDSFIARVDNMRNASDMIWLGVTEDIDIDSGTLLVLMQEAVCRCEIDIVNVLNIGRIRSAMTILSGMNESMRAVENTDALGSAKILFELNCNFDGSLHAEILTLGHCGMVRSHHDCRQCVEYKHYLDLLFLLTDGTSFYYTEDVTSQIHQQSVDYCHVVIDSLSIPDKGHHSGGFSWNVDDWESVEFLIKP